MVNQFATARATLRVRERRHAGTVIIPQGGFMRSTAFLVTAGTVAATLMACSSGIKVRTTAEPNANLTALRTFHVLAAPGRRADAPELPATDPMLTNSITNQELRGNLANAFGARGYTAASRDNADFVIAYYAGTKEKFNLAYWGSSDPAWGYHYWGRPFRAWPYYGYNGYVPGYSQVQEYTEGTLIVDVIDARSNQLLWRGQGVAAVSNDPTKYSSELARAARAIVKKFPAASVTTASGSQ
jgi:hypothetical protein